MGAIALILYPPFRFRLYFLRPIISGPILIRWPPAFCFCFIAIVRLSLTRSSAHYEVGAGLLRSGSYGSLARPRFSFR